MYAFVFFSLRREEKVLTISLFFPSIFGSYFHTKNAPGYMYHAPTWPVVNYCKLISLYYVYSVPKLNPLRVSSIW